MIPFEKRKNQLEKTKKSVLVYLLLAFALSTVCYVIWIRAGKAGDGMSPILMCCPAAVALTVRGIFYRGEKLLGWNPCKFSFLLAGIMIPVLYLGVSYGIYWLVSGASRIGALNPIAAVVATYTTHSHAGFIVVLIFILVSLFTAAGEEVGWRGFLLPQLAKLRGETAAIVITGLIWGIWHMPLIIAGLYLPGISLWFKLPMFLLQTVSMTAILGILRLRSGSVWPAVLVHASHNFFDQVICQPLTNSASSMYFVGETGILTLLAMILSAAAAKKFFSPKTTADPA